MPEHMRCHIVQPGFRHAVAKPFFIERTGLPPHSMTCSVRAPSRAPWASFGQDDGRPSEDCGMRQPVSPIMARRGEGVGALGRAESADDAADGGPEAVDGALGRLLEQRLSLASDLP